MMTPVTLFRSDLPVGMAVPFAEEISLILPAILLLTNSLTQTINYLSTILAILNIFLIDQIVDRQES